MVLGKTLSSHNASLQPRVKMGSGKLSGKPDEILEGGGGGNLVMDYHLSHIMLHGNREKLWLVVPLGLTTDF